MQGQKTYLVRPQWKVPLVAESNVFGKGIELLAVPHRNVKDRLWDSANELIVELAAHAASIDPHKSLAILVHPAGQGTTLVAFAHVGSRRIAGRESVETLWQDTFLGLGEQTHRECLEQGYALDVAVSRVQVEFKLFHRCFAVAIQFLPPLKQPLVLVLRFAGLLCVL